MGEWRFLLDENIDPKTGTYLGKEDIHAEHVRDALGQGADDEEDILPYARESGLIIVTSDVKDFGDLPKDARTDIVILYDDTMPAYQVASGSHRDGRRLSEPRRVLGARGARPLGVTLRADGTTLSSNPTPPP